MRSGPFIWTLVAIAAAVVIYGVISVLAVPKTKWTQLKRHRSNWILLMMVFGPLAVLLFFGTVRQHLLHPERYKIVEGVAEVDR